MTGLSGLYLLGLPVAEFSPRQSWLRGRPLELSNALPISLSGEGDGGMAVQAVSMGSPGRRFSPSQSVGIGGLSVMPCFTGMRGASEAAGSLAF